MRWLLLSVLMMAASRGSMQGADAVLSPGPLPAPSAPTSSASTSPAHTSSPAALKVGHPDLMAAIAAAIQPAVHEPSVHELAVRVDHHYNALHSLRVQFTETYAGMGLQRTESGTMLLKKSGIQKLSKMRWTYTSPAGKVFVLDGKYAWFYAPGDAQVQQLPASQLDDLRSPLRFLLGHTQLEKELSGLTMTPVDGGYLLRGVPQGMEKRVASTALSVTGDGTIRSMTIDETSGARTSLAFSGEQANVPALDADFVFTVPTGVPVVKGLPPV